LSLVIPLSPLRWPRVRMKVNVMGDAPASQMEWNEPFFRDCFDKVTKMITFVSHKQKLFSRFQILVHELI
jgi:hypothetical protein